MEDFDDWGLSAEDLDNLEKDAMKRISEKSSTATVSSSPTPPFSSQTLFSENRRQLPSTITSNSSYRKVEPASSSKPLSSREIDGNSSADSPKLSVRLYLHGSGVIAAKSPYHPSLVEAFHEIPKASWNGKERLWMFPISSLATAEEVFNRMTSADVEVQKLDPLVRRALIAASAAPDLLARRSSVCVAAWWANSFSR